MSGDGWADRTTYLGCSEIGGALGVPGAYRGPFATWLGKARPQEVGPPVPLLELGHILEPGLLLWASALLGLDLAPAGFQRHSVHEWLGGHPDALAAGAGVDTKLLVHGEAAKRADQWDMQCMGYMAVFDVPEWHLVWVSVPQRLPTEVIAQLAIAGSDAEAQLDVLQRLRGVEIDARTVARDPKLEAAMLEACGRWWRRHVVAGFEPEPDASKECGAYYLDKWAEPGPGFPVCEAAGPLVSEYAGLGPQIKGLQTRRKQLKHEIMREIGQRDGVSGEWGRCKWNRSNNTLYPKLSSGSE